MDVEQCTWGQTLGHMVGHTPNTGAYYGPIDFGLYSVKVISTDNSVQRLRNQKLNKTKCDFLGQIRLVTPSPDSPLPPPLGGVFRRSE